MVSWSFITQYLLDFKKTMTSRAIVYEGGSSELK